MRTIILFSQCKSTLPSLLAILLYLLAVLVKSSCGVQCILIGVKQKQNKIYLLLLGHACFSPLGSKEVKWQCLQATGTGAMSPTVQALAFDINSWRGLGQLTLSTPPRVYIGIHYKGTRGGLINICQASGKTHYEKQTL